MSAIKSITTVIAMLWVVSWISIFLAALIYAVVVAGPPVWALFALMFSIWVSAMWLHYTFTN